MTIFWQCLALFALAWVFFAFAGYPLSLSLLARIRKNPVQREAASDVASPTLSVIIAVYNEAGRLATKLEDTLALDYPDTFQIIVASDSSADESDAIARSFEDRGVELIRLPERGGKEAAQAAAIEAARGEVLVFTDVAAELAPDALVELVRPFADPDVACVSSEDRVRGENGETAYVDMEMKLRRLESDLGSIIGASGSCFAIRAEIADPWPRNIPSDFRSALESIRRGRRAAVQPSAHAFFGSTRKPVDEWRRRVRTSMRGIAVLLGHLDLLHPRFGFPAYALWGHKVARFTTPFALILAFVACAAASPESMLAKLGLAAQLGAYGLASATLAFAPLRKVKVFELAAFFLMVNSAIALAWIRIALGERTHLWEPTRREA
ncbi:MAG: glycosyltransferase [Myxococcota bacterium]